MSTKPKRKYDPIRDKYFYPLEQAENIFDALFYLSALLSLAIPVINKSAQPFLYEGLEIGFAVAIVCLFLLGLSIRLYLFPRAHTQRYRDFLSHAYGMQLGLDKTQGYYNNSANSVPKRIVAQVLENTFYSKDIAHKMARTARAYVLTYSILWLILVLNRKTDLSAIIIGAQIIFSEQVISRWIRVEWLRHECESVFDQSYQLIQTSIDMEARATELMMRYEIVKAIAGITLSKKIFDRLRATKITEWEEVRKDLFI